MQSLGDEALNLGRWNSDQSSDLGESDTSLQNPPSAASDRDTESFRELAH
jgi:hypothetical protein